MKVACWEHRAWRKKEHNYWSQDHELRTRCKQPSGESFVNMNSEQMQQLSVDRRGKDSSVSRGAWAAIFSNESSRDFLSFLTPEDDSYKGTVQWDLEDRMMRMMSARRTTFSGNTNASRSWWKTEPEPKVKVEIPNQHCQMEQMLRMRREAQLLMGWTL